MSSTLSMWLGIAFLVLGIAAVVLQAWLWNPKYWDPIAKKTHAPKAGLRLHRWVGIAFTVIYVVMMWAMLPRLWEYQVELPARTVAHAVAAIVLGVLLFTKLAILRWFRHFEESMPALGHGILVCTIVIATLSVPFAWRAQGLGGELMSAENLARVRGLLDGVAFEDELDDPEHTPVDRDALVTRTSLDRGRRVLVEQCTACHDMRTILAKPRTADQWFDISARMAEKPSVYGNPIELDDLPALTAYLAAITPELHTSRKRERRDERARATMVAGAMGATTLMMAAPVPAPAAAMPPAPVVPAMPRLTLQAACTQCHELDEIDAHGGDDAAGWSKVVREMIDEGAEISEADARVIVDLLVAEHPRR